LDVLESTLKENTKDLNSFDKYKQELYSGRLDWTPVHKDPVFWSENYKKFEENNYEVCSVQLA
jgi:V-type H+-transporting ATPase subunit H